MTDNVTFLLTPLPYTSTPLENCKASDIIQFVFRKSTLTAMQMIEEGERLKACERLLEMMNGSCDSERGEAAKDL